jgi:hypothetical protein
MARIGSLHKMSYAELAAVQTQVDHVMVEKQNAERIALRQKLADMAKDAGLSLDEVFGKGRKGKGTVAVKYRDPQERCAGWLPLPKAARPRRKIS